MESLNVVLGFDRKGEGLIFKYSLTAQPKGIGLNLFTMKRTYKRAIGFVALCSLFMVYPQQQAEAKFWGKETRVIRQGTDAGGGCYETVNTRNCAFWICGKGSTYDRDC